MKQVFSISRRTDIPAFYMPWFMDRVSRGTIEVVNPFNRQLRQVIVTPERVQTMVFWSKNFGPFLKARCGEKLQTMGYQLLFNFTVNSRSPILEPGVPDLDQRLSQLRVLVDRFGSASVQWRFDPICYFSRQPGVVESNLGDLKTIAKMVGEYGINSCTTSFMDPYRKIERRVCNRLKFIERSMEERVNVLLEMEQMLFPLGINLALCCEKEVLDHLPATSAIHAGECISGRRIMEVHGGRVSTRKDTGQRKAAGCGCTVSVDVGSYSLHPCHHNCLFCYANPTCDGRSG